jgi:basic membrane lipoprotein Med (substrate-binding protein (PBP1-ABC) superfamily)
MAVKKVDLYVTQLIEDLNNGLTWNKKDDLGYGSIEIKYGANEKQIAAIRKHPLLKDAETNIVIFNIIDDTKTTTTKTTEPDIVPMADLRTKTSVSEELEAFANL